MIIGHLSKIPFTKFSLSLLPVSIAGLAVEYAVLRFAFRNTLRAVSIQPVEAAAWRVDRRLTGLTFGVLVLVFGGFLAGFNLSWTALAGAALVMVLARRDMHEVFRLVDWNLLFFFAGLFVVVEGLASTGLPDQIYQRLHGLFGSSVAAQAWNLA